LEPLVKRSARIVLERLAARGALGPCVVGAPIPTHEIPAKPGNGAWVNPAHSCKTSECGRVFLDENGRPIVGRLWHQTYGFGPYTSVPSVPCPRDYDDPVEWMRAKHAHIDTVRATYSEEFRKHFMAAMRANG
jgi:hypothetical protein